MPLSHVVVILSYHGMKDTMDCVASLVQGNPDATVLVVDNGSYDGVIEEVLATWPHVKTLQTGSNLGFSGGINAGLRWAIRQGAETITILNNDTIVRTGVTRRLAWSAAAGAAVSPEVRYRTNPDRVWFGGGIVDPQTWLPRHLSESELERRPPGADGLRRSDVLTGCCVTATADTWQRIGMFDERYFLDFEDSDWSLRATAMRVPLAVDTRAVIEHSVSASFTGPFTYLGLYFYARNGLLFGKDHGASIGAQARFVRRHVIPSVHEAWRKDTAEGLRRTWVLARAMADHARGRYGPAPEGLYRRATRWSS